jgi:ribosomal protein L37E
MNNESKNEYLAKIKPRYQKAAKLEKVTILDEFCSTCGYNRKYAIRKFNAKNPPKNKYEYGKRGPRKKYGHPDIEIVLKSMWEKLIYPVQKD